MTIADQLAQALRDALLFIEALPTDLGRGSLNGMRVQVPHRISAVLAAYDAAPDDDAARFAFLQDKCSVTFLFRRTDGTSAHISGPIDLRAAIDAARSKP
jgi:hypothetical protein